MLFFTKNEFINTKTCITKKLEPIVYQKSEGQFCSLCDVKKNAYNPDQLSFPSTSEYPFEVWVPAEIWKAWNGQLKISHCIDAYGISKPKGTISLPYTMCFNNAVKSVIKWGHKGLISAKIKFGQILSIQTATYP